MASRAKEIKKMILGKMRRSNSGNLQDEKKKKEKLARASEDPSLLTRGGFNRWTTFDLLNLTAAAGDSWS